LLPTIERFNAQDGREMPRDLLPAFALVETRKHRAAIGPEINSHKVDRQLGGDPEASRPPKTLASLRRFMIAFAGSDAMIDTALRDGSGLTRWIALSAANAFCIAQIRIPPRFDTPEFMRTRKQNLPHALRAVASEITLDRYRGFPIDADFLYGRNLGDLPSLAGKKLALIGCGTIGGFLALQLAQTGAGSKSGRLVLFDEENLTPSNLGRHLLGLPDLYRNKAEGCAQHVQIQLPYLDIEARPVDVLQEVSTLGEFDLIIDATGEEALSIALNDYAVSNRPNFPPILHTWIVGNGGAAQAVLCDSAEHACFKCLKPDLAGQPRVRVLRPDAQATLRHLGACGDQLYAPFPVSVSAAAASLALDLILAWNTGRPGHLLRTRTFDLAQCFSPKDTTLEPSAACPACGTGRHDP
jgi:molybdopterin/thiamine biosynthesis adenylyltransferase